jgi:hypothetical protein
VLTLINQLASKFKTGMEEMLTGVLEAIFLRVDSVLQRPNAAAAVENTEEQRFAPASGGWHQGGWLLLEELGTGSSEPPSVTSPHSKLATDS